MKAKTNPIAESKNKSSQAGPVSSPGFSSSSSQISISDNREQTVAQKEFLGMATHRKYSTNPIFNVSVEAKNPPLQKTGFPLPKSAQSPIQLKRKEVLVTGLSHLVKIEGHTIYGGEEKEEVYQGQQLEIGSKKILSRRGPNQEEFSAEDKDGPHHYPWYKVYSLDGKNISKKELYVREDVFVHATPEKGEHRIDKVKDTVDAITAVPATFIGNEGITGLADVLNDKTIHTRTSGGPNATESGKAHAANMGIVGDGITGLSGLLGMAKGFKDLGDPEAKLADIIEAALTIEQGAMKTGEAVSKLVHTASKSTSPTDASRFGSAFEGFGSAFSGIKEGFEGMRVLVNLINKHQDYSTEEKAKASGEIALHALESGKSIVLTVKAFIELVDTGGASGQLMAAVPGLDIAISAGKMIMQGYYLAISNSNRNSMNIRRNEISGNSPERKAKLKQASEFYRVMDARIANKKEVIKEDKKRKGNFEANTAKRFFAENRKKQELESRIKKLNKEISILEKEEFEGVGREEVAEFTLATELKDANKKRVIRQGIHLATEMAKIAGSIATLTGMGAAAGAGIKGAAAAVDLALPATRMAKQAGRDRAARKIAKGKLEEEKGVFKFDQSKSTAAKTDFRTKQVKHFMRLAVGLAYKDPQKEQKDFEDVLLYIKASGVSKRKLFRNNGNPQEQIKLLLEAITTREFI
ncbi:hypothetical protein P872_10740 [Rhodonellum psychrophilum GCM71 = DSM 17998]|uniref:Uncharacterized protein n=2 Tax=Rhodonellum TaxID=336827 RepID=U5BXB7_9BACT|nr:MULTISPECIES: hypothetical protein [Rhodonellum]ERM81261.1 hypothetical protein P872_10740 [Rhodonellum psychrophilum GCM71 = DSM 17998]SDY55367.1 hypothetical protein SAMN05444412_101515 [Rhodonellum ikkaensis]